MSGNGNVAVVADPEQLLNDLPAKHWQDVLKKTVRRLLDWQWDDELLEDDVAVEQNDAARAVDDDEAAVAGVRG